MVCYLKLEEGEKEVLRSVLEGEKEAMRKSPPFPYYVERVNRIYDRLKEGLIRSDLERKFDEMEDENGKGETENRN